MTTAIIISVCAVALGIAIFGWVYDVKLTVAGIAAGVGVESNDWLIGPKPTAKALYLRDSLTFVPFAVAPIVFILISWSLPITPFAAGPVVFGVVHFRAGRKWLALLNQLRSVGKP